MVTQAPCANNRADCTALGAEAEEPAIAVAAAGWMEQCVHKHILVSEGEQPANTALGLYVQR